MFAYIVYHFLLCLLYLSFFFLFIVKKHMCLSRAVEKQRTHPETPEIWHSYLSFKLVRFIAAVSY